MDTADLVVATLVSGVVAYTLAGLVVAFRYASPGPLARVAIGLLWPAVSIGVVLLWLAGIDEPPRR